MYEDPILSIGTSTTALETAQISIPIQHVSKFGISDRPLSRIWRALAARPYLGLSALLHLMLAIWLLQVSGMDSKAKLRETNATRHFVQQQMAQTELREMQRRVQRLEEIRLQLTQGGSRADASVASAPSASSSPAELAARAAAIYAEIDAENRRLRSARLARLTGLSPAEAARKIDAETIAERSNAPGATPAERIANLERQARQSLDVQRSEREVKRNGMPVQLPTLEAIAAANKSAELIQTKSGSTGQTHVADGIPRSRAEQLAAIVRLGTAQGRVGVKGSKGGLSVNREGVKGEINGRDARADDDQRDAGSSASRNGHPEEAASDPRPKIDITAHGSSIDLTGDGASGSHDLVHYVDGPDNSAQTDHRAMGRVFGAGGTFVQRDYLNSWYVIGPFAAHGEDPLESTYPPEDDVDLDAVYEGKDNRVLKWNYESRGFYPFIPSDVTDNAVYYAYTDLKIDEERDVWLAIGAADDSKLWLDGRQIWVSAPGDKPWYHFPFYNRDELVASYSLVEGQRRVHLSRGRHELLFKLFNGHDRAFFSIVITPG